MNGGLHGAREWPSLDWSDWQETAETLHMFLQIVGKTRLALTPRRNHWWNVPLYVTARGLSTSAMPLPDGDVLDIEFDFIAHRLVMRRGSGRTEQLPLVAQPVAAFYEAYQRTLASLAVAVVVDRMRVECSNPIRFDLDRTHQSYDREAVQSFQRVLSHAEILFQEFSTQFLGKISPVHFFWGSFDLAVTRFSGRRAPPRPGADAIQAEAYSHECISAGFWPGNGGYGRAAFYCHAAPVPRCLGDTVLAGAGAFNRELGEFQLDYAEVRRAVDPAETIAEFLRATYSTYADAAKWDRANLERQSR